MKKYIFITIFSFFIIPFTFADIRDSLDKGWNLVSDKNTITTTDVSSSTLVSIWGITTDSTGIKRWCLLKGTSTAVSSCPNTFSGDNRAWVEKK